MKIKFIVLIGALSLAGCKNDQNDPCSHGFDQLPMLAHIGEQIVLPRYAGLETRLDALKAAAEQLTAQPDQSNLDATRTAWQAAYLYWQRASLFEFGPADSRQLRSKMGLFPVFTGRIENNISSGSYDLSAMSNEYARGLPAVEYLLYGTASDDAGILAKFVSDAQAAARRQYLTDLCAAMLQEVQTVHHAWRSDGGNYISTFKNTSGVAQGTPVSFLVNALSQHYESIKNNKIGTPVGAKTGYVAAPDKVEALFCPALSIPLALAALQGSQDLFNGKSESGAADGLGLDDYLNATGAQQAGQPLAQLINNQYTLATNALNALLPATLYDALGTQLQAVKTAYAHIVNQIVYIKTDMPSVLCVSITYVDNTDDGD